MYKILLLLMVLILFFGTLLWIVVTQPSFGSKRKNRGASVDPARLEAHVRVLSEKFVPRDESHPENLEKVAAYVREHFEAAKGRVCEQPYEVREKTYRNVMARFGPDEGERIVVGAHYDAAGPFPAADDNASAVAGLIELAYRLGEKPPPVCTELVAFTLEEPPYFTTPHMGSAVHAASLREQDVPVRIMICLEMIGYFSDAENSQNYPLAVLKLPYPSQGNFIAVVGKLNDGELVRRVKNAMQKASPLPVWSINAPSIVPGIDFSDHRNYWEAGYPAVMITDTAFFRNPNYHTAQDTPDTLDYERMAMVVKGVHAAVLEFAGD